MNREIKFRGLSINGDWYYGLLSISQGKGTQPAVGYYISNSAGMPWAYQVRPESVGQYAGLKDKNGKEIYDGDVMEWMETEAIDYNQQFDHDKHGDTPRRSVFHFKNGAFSMRDSSPFTITAKMIAVIGNIYQNPELLKSQYTIMNIEHQVCPLNQAKQLKIFGIGQNSIILWLDYSKSPHGPKLVWYDVMSFEQQREYIYAAFNVAELSAMLPSEYYSYRTKHGWLTYDDRGKNLTGMGYSVTEAASKATMLLFLLESGKVTAEEVNTRLANS